MTKQTTLWLGKTISPMRTRSPINVFRCVGTHRPQSRLKTILWCRP